MKLALAVLDIVGVIFLLRVLAALVKEEWNSSSRTVKFHWARFHPSRRRGELIVMNPDLQSRETPPRTGERIAI